MQPNEIHRPPHSSPSQATLWQWVGVVVVVDGPSCLTQTAMSHLLLH